MNFLSESFKKNKKYQLRACICVRQFGPFWPMIYIYHLRTIIYGFKYYHITFFRHYLNVLCQIWGILNSHPACHAYLSVLQVSPSKRFRMASKLLLR